MRRSLLAATLAGLTTALLAAQDIRPAFDVISIKQNKTNQGIPIVAFQPGGRLIAGNVVVRQVILVAYGLEDIQLSNAPDWLSTERFAIEARAADDTPTATIRTMLQSMLMDRFGLAAHREQRDLPMFALTMARPDKRLGPRLKASGPECAPVQFPAGVPAPPPPPPPPPGNGAGRIRLILPTDEPLGRRCGAMMAPGWMSARSIAMKEFARSLAQVVRRPVIDETGLTGEFDLDVIFAPDSGGGVLVGPPPAAFADAPALPTALQDDLGLKLDPRRGPVDVLVIDRIERPTEN